MKQDATESVTSAIPTVQITTAQITVPLVTFTPAPPTIEWFNRDETKPAVGKTVMLAAENGRVCIGHRSGPLALYHDERGKVIDSRITHWAWVPVAPGKDPRR